MFKEDCLQKLLLITNKRHCFLNAAEYSQIQKKNRQRTNLTAAKIDAQSCG